MEDQQNLPVVSPERQMVPGWDSIPQLALKSAEDRRLAIESYIKGRFRPGIHWSHIADNKYVTRAGAEIIGSTFHLVPKYIFLKETEDHHAQFYAYVVECELSAPDGFVLARGIGACNSHEKASRYREETAGMPQQHNIVTKAMTRAYRRAIITAFALTEQFWADELEAGEAAAGQAGQPKRGRGRPRTTTPPDTTGEIFPKEDPPANTGEQEGLL